MGNHRKNMFLPIMHPIPNCALGPSNDSDNWARLLSTSTDQHIKRLQIAQNNKAIHLVLQTINANKDTWFFALANARTINN